MVENYTERVPHALLPVGVVLILAWWVNFALYVIAPRDYTRIVFTRPKTPGAVVSSWMTYFEWAMSVSPELRIAVGWSGLVVALVLVVYTVALFGSGPA